MARAPKRAPPTPARANATRDDTRRTERVFLLECKLLAHRRVVARRTLSRRRAPFGTPNVVSHRSIGRVHSIDIVSVSNFF